jgi:hypothetical protein
LIRSQQAGYTEWTPPKSLGHNSQIQFAEVSGVGDHVHFCDFPLLHCAANHDTQLPSVSYGDPHGSVDKKRLCRSGKIRVCQRLFDYLRCTT